MRKKVIVTILLGIRKNQLNGSKTTVRNPTSRCLAGCRVIYCMRRKDKKKIFFSFSCNKDIMIICLYGLFLSLSLPFSIHTYCIFINPYFKLIKKNFAFLNMLVAWWVRQVGRS